jgi:hypothetical protein
MALPLVLHDTLGKWALQKVPRQTGLAYVQVEPFEKNGIKKGRENRDPTSDALRVSGGNWPS